MSFLPLDQMSFGDSASIDAFGNLKVATSNTLFDAQQEYGLDTLRIWNITANGTLPTFGDTNGSISSAGNSVGPTDLNSRMTPVVVSATNGHYATLQSKQYVRYIPGHAHDIKLTGIFAAQANYTAALRLRSSCSGSVVDVDIAQASWSEDTFTAGSTRNPSGITIDFTKIQILVIDAQMLYAGRIRIGFDIDGTLYWAHYFKIANNQIPPTMQTFNLPVSVDGRTGASTTSFAHGYFDMSNGVALVTTSTTKGGTTQFECCAVHSSGGLDSRGFTRSANGGTATIGVTTRRPVFSIRPRTTYNGRTNRGHIELLDFKLRAKTNDGFYEVVVGGTLTGAAFAPVGTPITAGSFLAGARYIIRTVGTTDFTLIGAASNTVGVAFTATGVGVGTGTAVVESTITEFDTSATAISGGEVISDGYVLSGAGAGASALSNVTTSVPDFRMPLVLSKMDALAATQTNLTIVCTSFTGTCDVVAGMSWHEQTV